MSYAPCVPRTVSRRMEMWQVDEKGRGNHQALQARRSEGGAPRGRHPGHHGHRGQGFWPAKGPYRALSRRRVRGRFFAEGQNRGGHGRRARRAGDRGHSARRPYRPDRRRQDLRHDRRRGGPDPHRGARSRRDLAAATRPPDRPCDLIVPLRAREALMPHTFRTADDVLRTIKDDKIAMIDLRFTDLPGLWQHFSVPPSALDADSFEDGVGFDGSSIRGFQEIQESDMLVIPDPASAFLDPFTEVPTLVLICNIRDPITGQTYTRDARYIAQKAETYLQSTRIGDTAYFGPELEHFVFNQVRYDQSTNYGYYEIDAVEANWSAARREGPGLGHILRPKEGYFPVPPADVLQDARTEMVMTLEKLGIRVEAHHHEVATGGQGEIDMR